MTKPIQILHLEDNADDAELVKVALKSAGLLCQIKLIQSEQEYSRALQQGEYDLILTDYSLPDYDGLTALRLAQQVCPEVPFVFISGKMGEDTAIEALTQGATDYVLKQKLSRLVPAVQRALQEAKNQKQRQQAEEELRHERNLLRTLIDSIPDYIYIKDNESRFITCNTAEMLSLGQKNLEQVYGKTDFDFHIPEYATKFFADEQELLRSGQPLVSQEELIFDHYYNQLQYILTTKMPLRDQQGKIIGLVGIGRNITERKQAEAQIERQLSQLEALHAIDTAISSTFDTQRTLRVLIDQVIRQLEVDAAAILLYDSNNQRLRYTHWTGFNTIFVQWPNLRLGESRAGMVAREKKPLQIENFPAELNGTELDQLLREEGFRSYYAVPLVAFDAIKGVLEVYHRRPLNPSKDWLDFLNTLAGQAAIAIDTARLFNDLQRSHNQLVAAYDATIEGWSRALDMRDRETEGHTLRVTEMTVQLARSGGMSEQEIDFIRWGALLHDIGKMGIPDKILLKTGPLTDAEWVIMRQHPNYAHELLKPIEYLWPSLDIPYCHHEKWDGSGYPRGLQGEQIPLAARIFAVADVWDALCSVRPYREAWPKQRALDQIWAGIGSHFDPQIVEVFLQFVERKMALTPTTPGRRSQPRRSGKRNKLRLQIDFTLINPEVTLVKILKKHVVHCSWAVLWLSGFLMLTWGGCGRGPTIQRLGPEAVVLAFGDSLTAGSGAGATETYPAVLAEIIQRRVINAGVSGEVAARGLERLPGLLVDYHPELVILCHGGNDLLLQNDPAELKTTLARMIELLQKQGIDVVIVGVPQPALILRTAPFYQELAQEYRLPYEGKVLKEILGRPSLKSDEIHPNGQGYRQLAAAIAVLIERSQTD